MESTLVIYDKSGGEIIPVPITRESTRKRVLMADNYLLLVFNHSSFFDFKKGCYVIYNDFRFEIMTDILPERLANGWKYSLKFEAKEGFLKKYSIVYRDQDVEEFVFALTTDLLSFGNIVCDCINHELGVQNWRVKSIPAEFAGLIKTLSFKGEKLFDANTMIANEFGCEWWTEVNGNFVDLCFGKLVFGTEEVLNVGEVVKSISLKSGDDSSFGTRFYVFGSSRNLTPDYGQAQQGGSTNHISEVRLRLPDGMKYVDAWDNLAPEDIVHQVVFFDEIYPKNTDIITKVETVNRQIEGGGTFKAYVVTVENTPFLPSDIIKGETLECVFESGALQGRTFELKINYNPDTWKPSDGFDKKFEIIHSNEGDIIIPNESFKPVIEDKFVITGVKLSATRIIEAERELLEAGIKLSKERSRDTSVCECPTNPVCCCKNNKDYDIGQKVSLVDGDRFGAGRNSRIQGYEKKLWNPYEATYTVGDNPQYSRLGSIEGDIKASQYSERIGVTSGVGIYLIRDRFDNTQPTNYNTYSSLASIKKFATNALFYEHIDQPVRVKDDVEFNSVTSEEFTSKSFVSGLLGVGHRLFNGVLEVNEIIVRKVMHVFEIIIQKTSSVNGSTLTTPGGGIKIAQLEELETGYKCFFNNDEGTIPNPYIVGDQLLHQVFTGKGIGRYWRLVTEVGDDYFILSKTDCEAGSGIPAVNDEVIQFGNRTDRSRQNATLTTSYGSNAPYTACYSGVNNYSLEGKEIVRQGNLEGIVDPDFGQLIGTGFYGQNVFLKGVFKLLSGKTVDQAISDSKQESIQAAQGIVDNLQIGGVNLFPISRLNAITYRGSSTKVGSGYETIFKCRTAGSWGILPVSIPTPLIPINSDFVISFDIRDTDDFGFEITGTSDTPTIIGLVKFSNPTGEWIRFSKVYNSGSRGDIGGINLWGIGDITRIKIEKGNKVTDPSPAPEDQQFEIQKSKNEAIESANVASQAKIDLLKIQELAALDGKIDDEEARAIKDAQDKYDAAVREAQLKADAAKAAAVNTASVDAIQKALGASWSSGNILYADPTFKSGLNGVLLYNNSGNNVILNRIPKITDSPANSDYNIEIKNIGAANPLLGGFHFGNQSRANAVFICRFIAKIPVGYSVRFASNSIGDDSVRFFSTPNVGTGRWEEYICVVKCGSKGSFSATNFFYLEGAVGTPGNPVVWYLAYASVFDVTDGINAQTEAIKAQQSVMRVTEQVTELSAETGRINLSVSQVQEKVNNTKIGTVNIFNNSGNFESEIKNWYDNSGGLSVDSGVKYNGYNTIKTSVGAGISGDWYKLENGVEYCYSVMVKADANFAGGISTPLHWWAGKDNQSQSKIEVLEVIQHGNANEWTLLYIVFKLTYDADSFKPFIYWGNHVANFNIAFLCLTKGNKPMQAWSPSLQDQEDLFNKAKQEAISAAATDATNKSEAAKNTAIGTASTDATNKANNAKNEAITSANTYTDGRTESMWKGWIDASGLDQNKYYPVVFYCPSGLRATIRLEVALPYNSKPSWSTHEGGFSVRCVWSVNGGGWGTIEVNRIVDDFTCSFVQKDANGRYISPAGSIGQMINSSNEYIYVRGGGKYYFTIINGGTPVLKTDTYTKSGQTIYIKTSVDTPEITGATKTELRSEITVLTGQINAKVSQTIYDSEKQVINSSLSQLQINYNSISQTVVDVNNRLGTIEAAGIVTQSNFVTIFAGKQNELGNAVIAAINVAPESVKIRAKNIDLDGIVSVGSAGQVTINDGKITAINVDISGTSTFGNLKVVGSYLLAKDNWELQFGSSTLSKNQINIHLGNRNSDIIGIAMQIDHQSAGVMIKESGEQIEPGQMTSGLSIYQRTGNAIFVKGGVRFNLNGKEMGVVGGNTSFAGRVYLNGGADISSTVYLKSLRRISNTSGWDRMLVNLSTGEVAYG